MKEARQRGLRSYVDKKGVPPAYRRHVAKLRKAAEDSALGLAGALKVLTEDEVSVAPEVRRGFGSQAAQGLVSLPVWVSC